jgi:hypothetical protein
VAALIDELEKQQTAPGNIGMRPDGKLGYPAFVAYMSDPLNEALDPAREAVVYQVSVEWCGGCSCVYARASHFNRRSLTAHYQCCTIYHRLLRVLRSVHVCPGPAA